MKLSVKKGDNVLVIAGKDAKKTGEVLEVNRETGRVVVAGVNIQAHHKKPRTKDDKGGIIKMEGAIDVSNVQVVCPTCKQATRVAHKLVNGKMVRACKKCGAELDVKGAKKAAKTAPKAEKVEAKAAPKAAAAKTEKPAAKATTKAAEKPATKTTKAAATKTTEKPATKTTTKTKTASSSKKA